MKTGVLIPVICLKPNREYCRISVSGFSFTVPSVWRKKDMFRLWAKEFKDNRMLRDMVVCEESEDTRTHKIFHALDEICYAFDLSKPIWLDSTIDEFKRHAKARFYQDNFVDAIDFDYLEIQVIEED